MWVPFPVFFYFLYCHLFCSKIGKMISAAMMIDDPFRFPFALSIARNTSSPVMRASVENFTVITAFSCLFFNFLPSLSLNQAIY